MLILWILIFLAGCTAKVSTVLPASSPKTLIIKQKPILFNSTRITLTQNYRKQHYGITSQSIQIVPQIIVLHWTAMESLQTVYNFFYSPLLNWRPELAPFGLLNVSSQFLVDRDGTIYQLMPSNWMARHVIGLDNLAIGIENVGGKNDKQDLTYAQVNADAKLIRYLIQSYPTIHYLIGHYEYGRFKNTPLWQEKNPHYFTFKSDPGPIFMKQVRAQVADLNLKSNP